MKWSYGFRQWIKLYKEKKFLILLVFICYVIVTSDKEDDMTAILSSDFKKFLNNMKSIKTIIYKRTLNKYVINIKKI
jgi:hypothetical protein